MLLDVTTASTDAQLTTTAAVKAMLRTTSTSDDTLLDNLITRASAWAEAYVGYPLPAQSYLESVATYGTRRLMLARTPVRAVTGLFNGTDSGDYTQVDTSEFAVDREAGFIERNIGWAWSVPFESYLDLRPNSGEEMPIWRAEYIAGYVFAGMSTSSSLWSTVKGTTSTGRTLPADIEAAVISKVATWYQGDEDVRSKSIGDLSVTYDENAKDPAMTLLAPYRRSA